MLSFTARVYVQTSDIRLLFTLSTTTVWLFGELVILNISENMRGVAVNTWSGLTITMTVTIIVMTRKRQTQGKKKNTSNPCHQLYSKTASDFALSQLSKAAQSNLSAKYTALIREENMIRKTLSKTFSFQTNWRKIKWKKLKLYFWKYRWVALRRLRKIAGPYENQEISKVYTASLHAH